MTCKHEKAEWVFCYATTQNSVERTFWTLTCPDCGEVLDSGFKDAVFSGERQCYVLSDSGEVPDNGTQKDTAGN